ncbi:MAG: serine/threonine-protein kinase [Candidatus Latescibacterota bacterium]|jgi:tetratricopeptide (TPR) repeat protein|nr:MAG: serine/threonine-protein kinase [Candidatus Latescibacterota bacterium]
MDTHIRHYRLLEKLGSGGMGVVYKAEDTLLKRVVALKFPPEMTVADETSQRRFLREARAASALDHPNICSIHSIEETDDGRPFICMSWCDGATLREILSRGRMDPLRAVDIVLQVASGLETAHQSGIVHRDIKPGNIMVSTKGQAKILDFGIARITDATRITKSGAGFGTVLYMSPEQVRGDAADHRSDIWSLGVVLYELLAGVPPFPGEYEAAVLYSIVNDGFEPASRASPQSPHSLDAVIERALQKRPANRYASIAEMIRDLETVHASLVSHAGTKRAQLPRHTALHFARRRPIVAIAFCALAAALVAMVFNRFAPRERLSAAVIRIDAQQARARTGAPIDDLLASRLEGWPLVRLLHDSRLREIRSARSAGTIRTVGGAAALVRRAGAELFIVPKLVDHGDSTELFAHVYDASGGGHPILSVRSAEAGRAAAVLETLLDRTAERIIERSRAIPALAPASNARTLFEKGNSLYLHGDFEAGIPLVELALQEDSTLIPAYHRLALWYRYENRRTEALICAQRAVALSKDDPVLSLRAEIVLHRVAGRSDLAEAALRRYLAITPPNCAGLAELGYVLYHDRRLFEAAVQPLQRALELDPQDLDGMRAKVLDCLGHAYLYSGRYDEAEGCFEKYAVLDTANFDAIHSLATLNRTRGNYEAAIEGYKRTKKLRAGFFPAYDELALTYLAIGKRYKALDEIKTFQIETHDSLGVKAHALKGMVHFIQGEYEEASRASRMAVAIDSLWIPAQWLRGRAALELDRLREAREALARIARQGAVMNAADDSAYVHNLHGWILLAEGRAAEGIRELERSPFLSLENAMEFRKDLVRGLLRAGRVAEAERRALEALSYNDADADLLALLCEICFRKNDRRGAARYFKLARSVWEEADSDFAPLRRLISQAPARWEDT